MKFESWQALESSESWLQISLGPRQQVLWDDPIHIKPTEHVYMYIIQPENIQELRSAYFSWRGMFI